MRYNRATQLVAGTALTLLSAFAAVAQSTTAPGEVSLDSLLNTRISAASKYLQTSAEAAASVTILSADEIHQMGYTNLLEILESVPGMYVSNDRNYPYLGTRGFGRPSDFNNRILVLVDGHTLNEQVWGGTPVGTDLPINIDGIERIEVVRGPGSVLYGTSAMFAVINIVMKSATRVSGATTSFGIGSGMQKQFGATVGHVFGSGAAFTVSALGTASDGKTLHYSEYASIENPRGTVRNLDWENGGSVIGSLITGPVTTRVGYRSRSKGIPTGAYDAMFGEKRAHTVDESLWGEVAARRDFGARYRASARVYADRNLYRGLTPYSTTEQYTDRANSTDAGAEGMLIWDASSRNRLTLGTEFRRMFIAEYFGRGNEGEKYGANAPYSVVSFLAQDELELTARLKLVGGLRFDRQLNRWQATAPRFALVASPDNATTVKLLYGEAFRAPSVAEADLEAATHGRNELLQRERIVTYELTIERRLAPALLFGVSGYRYSIRNLIEQAQYDSTNGVLYTNRKPVDGHGVELSVNLQPVGSHFAVRGWYTLQKAYDDSSRLKLTNSPAHTANMSIMVRPHEDFHAALTVRGESGRLMLNGESTPSFARSDVNLSYAPTGAHLGWMHGFDISVRASNLLNTRYAVPGGLEHVQQSIEQDRRMLSLRVRREF